MVNLEDPNLAEYIYHFVMDDDSRRYEWEVEIFSMAEFVEEYYLDEFENWLKRICNK